MSSVQAVRHDIDDTIVVLALVLAIELDTCVTMLDGELDDWIVDWLLDTTVIELNGVLEALIELVVLSIERTVDDCEVE